MNQTTMQASSPPAPARPWAQEVVAFGVGLVFAMGLGLSGMTQPQNIIAFLDLQAWNPALLFVMVGAISVYALGLRVVAQFSQPVLGGRFELPTQRNITWPLVLGSGMFGVGWGLAGFCGGPALVSLVTGQLDVLVFVGTMLLGMWSCQRFVKP